MGCRNPKVLADRYDSDAAKETTWEGVFTRQIATVVNDMCTWFPDLLEGDCNQIQDRDRYDAFVEEVERLALGPMQKLPYDDPIAEKSRRLDFSWVDDLKAKLARKASGSQISASGNVQVLTAFLSLLGIGLLLVVVCHFVPLLFTGMAPQPPDGDLPIGSSTVLRGVPTKTINEFWPLRFSVWFAFSPMARLSFAILVVGCYVASTVTAGNSGRLVPWGLVVILAMMLVINMIAIFHVF